MSRAKPATNVIRSASAAFQRLDALRSNRNTRFQEQRFLVQGVKAINAAVEHGWSIAVALVADEVERSSWADSICMQAKEVVALAPPLQQQLSERESGSEVIAVVEMRTRQISELQEHTTVVVLDRPSSPGNIGTVIRSADAFGGAAVVVVGHAADPFDPKCVRASTGSLFAVPVASYPGSIRELRSELPLHQFIGLDEHGTVELSEFSFSERVALLIGNEERGLSKSARESVDVMLKIEMAGHATSLNMAVATGITLYQRMRASGGT
jgi:tRNA G18 (ribose-2'-O)-methylase SpoU